VFLLQNVDIACGKQDFNPLLDFHEIPYIYVDLWENRPTNPATVIYSAIQRKLAEDHNFVDKDWYELQSKLQKDSTENLLAFGAPKL